MKPHPIALCYPALTAEEFTNLRDHIENNGLQNPIVLFEEMILDGVHRQKVCDQLGIRAQYVAPPIKDPFEYVIGQNERRRQLAVGQKAVVAERMATLKHGGDRTSQESKRPGGLLKSSDQTIRATGKRIGVGETSIKRARYAKTHGIPQLLDAVEKGELTVKAAAQIAHKPKEQQAAELQATKTSKPSNRKKRRRAQIPLIYRSREIRNLPKRTLTQRCGDVWFWICSNQLPQFPTPEERQALYTYLRNCLTKAIGVSSEVDTAEEIYELTR